MISTFAEQHQKNIQAKRDAEMNAARKRNKATQAKEKKLGGSKRKRTAKKVAGVHSKSASKAKKGSGRK